MRLTVPNVFTENGDTFRVGISSEGVASLHQDVLEFLVVGDDTVVNQAEFGDRVTDVRVTVSGAWNTVGSPSSVSHGGLGDEHFGHVDWLARVAIVGVFSTGERGSDSFSNVFSESGNFADLFEKDDRRSGGVAVDTDTCSVCNIDERSRENSIAKWM